MIYLAAFLYVCGMLLDLSHRYHIAELQKRPDPDFADFMKSVCWPGLFPLALISTILLSTGLFNNDPR